MPHVTREGRLPVVVNLTGASAARLAATLFAERPDGAPWDAIAAHAGPASRVAHDWDPATGTLVIAAGLERAVA